MTEPRETIAYASNDVVMFYFGEDTELFVPGGWNIAVDWSIDDELE